MYFNPQMKMKEFRQHYYYQVELQDFASTNI